MTQLREDLERETSYTIKDEDIERAKKLIGWETAQSQPEYYTVATPDAMKNFARGYGDDNPLFADPEYGKSTRWGGQIAPPMIGIALRSALYGDPLPDEIKQLQRGLFTGIHVFVSGQSTEWYRPVYVGDSLYNFGGAESVQEKKSEFSGRSVIRVHRTVSMNQRAEIVSVSRMLAILTERKTARERGKYAHIKPTIYTDEQIAEIDEIYAKEKARGPETRYWEDVEIGEPLPKMVKGPLTLTDIICFHAGGYGFIPYNVSPARLGYKNRQRIPKFYIKNAQGIPDVSQRVHWETEWAQAIGNPMPYDYGVMRQCWASHFLTDWMGDDGWLFRQHDEMRKFNYIGDTQIITGEVTDKRIEDGRYYVDIEFRMTNQRGEITTPGNATVILPSRADGPVILPEPPMELKKKAIEMMKRHHEIARERRGRA